MQHAPLAQLPEQRHHTDWGVIIATILVLGIAGLTLVVLLGPGLIFAPVESNLVTNPELAAFERYQAAGPAAAPIVGADNPELAAFERFQAAAQVIAGPDNPELAAFSRYVELHAGDQMLRDNPEVRQFRQWLEGQ